MSKPRKYSVRVDILVRGYVEIESTSISAAAKAVESKLAGSGYTACHRAIDQINPIEWLSVSAPISWVKPIK